MEKNLNAGFSTALIRSRGRLSERSARTVGPQG
uniref:Uncharacterized protein n=1 Tax=Anguilla anguilla TaxID=7936 RepID=A0A0E9RVY0_ANGAN